jgi:hypothetical protein
MQSPMPRAVAAFVVLAALALPARASADDAKDRYLRDRTGLMTVLAAWGAGSIATGAAMWAASDAPAVRYAGIQNVAWGAIDGAIAALALAGTPSDRANVDPGHDWAGDRATLGKVFFVNALLDVAYVAVGALLVTLSSDPKVRGTGAGIVAQGAFLLTFDASGAVVMAR